MVPAMNVVGLRRSTALAATCASFVLAAMLLAAPSHALEEAVKTITSRPGVTESFLLIKPDAPPVASVVLFAGSEGVVNLQNFQSPTWGTSNFLVRNRRRFAEQGLLVAVLDVPSDHSTGLGSFRTSADHARDVAAVIAALRQESPAPVWLVGTSMGAVSAVNAAARLKEGGPDGLVLTSTVTHRTRNIHVTVNDVALDEIRVPTLVVHHEADGCVASPFGAAKVLDKALKRAPKKAFMAFTGGTDTGNPCEGMAAHGYNGIDDQVVQAITGWIKQPR